MTLAFAALRAQVLPARHGLVTTDEAETRQRRGTEIAKELTYGLELIFIEICPSGTLTPPGRLGGGGRGMTGIAATYRFAA